MATRIYLPNTGTAPITNATVGTWTETTGFDRVAAVTTRISSAMTNKVQAHAATAANSTYLSRQYVLGPLAGQTYAASTVKGTIRVLESAANDNLDAMRMSIRVCAPDGTTFRTAIWPVSNSTVLEFNTTLRAKRLATGGVTTQSVITEGDYLIIEIGTTNTTIGASLSDTISYGDDNAADLGDNETDTTALNPFIELAGNMTFLRRGFGQAQADILKTTNVFAQSQSDIKATSNKFAQAQTKINSFNVKAFAQARAYIFPGTWWLNAQAQANIYNPYLLAQAQAYIGTRQRTPWTLAPSTAFLNTSNPQSFAFGNGYWVTVTSGAEVGYIADPPTGTWTVVSDPFVASQPYGVFFANDYFIAVGGESTQKLAYAYKTPVNGFTENISTQGLSAGLRSVAFDGTYYVAVGGGGLAVWATDPTGTWTVVDAGFGASNIQRVWYSDGYWVAVGSGGKLSYTSNPTVTWTINANHPWTSGEVIGDVKFGGGLWVAVGLSNAKSATTTDPTGTWTQRDSFTTNSTAGLIQGPYLTYGNGVWVAIGQNDTTLKSRISVAINPDRAGGWSNDIAAHNNSQAIEAVWYGNGYFYAGGTQTLPNYTLQYSQNPQGNFYTPAAQAQAKISTTRQYAQTQSDIKAISNKFAQAQSTILATSNRFAQANARITSFVTSGIVSGSTTQTITLNGLQENDKIIAWVYYPNTLLVSLSISQDTDPDGSGSFGAIHDKIGTTNTLTRFYSSRGIKRTSNSFILTITVSGGTGIFLAQAAAFRAGQGLIYLPDNVNVNNTATGTNPSIGSPTITAGQFPQDLVVGAAGINSTATILSPGLNFRSIALSQSSPLSLTSEYYDWATSSIAVDFQDSTSAEWEGIADSFIKARVTFGSAQAQASIKVTSNGFAQAQAKITTTRNYGQANALITLTQSTHPIADESNNGWIGLAIV